MRCWLAARGGIPRRAENGETPAWQGARSAHIGNMQATSNAAQAGWIAGRTQWDFRHGLLGATLAAILLAPAGAAAADQGGKSGRAIESLGVLYDVDAPFGARGISLSLVRQDGDGYVYETFSRGLGLARLVIASDALESAHFDLDAGGRVRALEYRCRSCDGDKDGRVSIAFDWANRSALFSENDEQMEFSLEPRAMDRKAWEIQSMLDLADGLPLDLQPTIEDGKLKQYGSELLGEEVLSARAGDLQTVKYRRQREGSDNFQYIWYAKELGWLPARWEIWRKDKRMIIIEAEEYRWGEDAALAMRQDWLDR